MPKLPTKTGFGLPLQEMVKPMGASAKAARLREAGSRFEAQLRELERQFDAKAKELREEYVSAVDELNGEEQSQRDGQARERSTASNHIEWKGNVWPREPAKK
jgi:hypothetical protein